MHESIDWEKIIIASAREIETKLKLNLVLESFVLEEIKDRVAISLKSLDMSRPNVAKIAGTVAFWIRKLKPLSHSEEFPNGNKFYAVNELLGLRVGLYICANYYDDYSTYGFKLSRRLFLDWVHSLRYHSHSPHSSLTAFELLTTSED